jgi:uncharacterized protein
MSVPLGAPVWIDLSTSDVVRAQQFYGAVFGWTFDSPGPDYGGYVNASKDGRHVAGLMANPAGPDRWTTYFHTADAAATAAQATAAGASTVMGPLEVPAKGWMAILTDPAGAPFGLWQPTGHAGFDITHAAGAPVWFQLTTHRYDAALDFYRDLFGWQTRVESDVPEFRYTNAIVDGEPVLGVMDGSAILPADTPSDWVCFLGADDVDKTVQLIVDNGGSVLRDAEDTPYGRLAAAADPTGGQFNLSSLPG